MTRFLEFPDIEAIAATALRNAAIPNVNGVFSSVPKTPTYPLLTVIRTGGSPAVREYLDTGVIEIAVWGGSKSTARDIAARARVVLLELDGTVVTDPVRAVIGGVEDARGLTWQPDEPTGRDRYTFAMEIYARSN